MTERAAWPRRLLYPVLSIFALSVSAVDSVPAVPGARAADITVRSVQGKTVKPFAGNYRRATLLFFIAHDCPISNAYAPEMARVCKAYESRGVATYVVYVEKDLKAGDARKHAKDYAYPCPALMDPQRKLIRFTGARMTPEAVVVAPDGKTVYRGRIDNTYITYGKRRDEPTSRDLRRALDAHLARKPVTPNRTAVVGCYIPDI